MAAGKALFDLETLLRSSKEKITLEEDNVVTKCKLKAVRDFVDGLIAGGAIAWAATWKLHTFLRLNILGGAGIIFGFRRFTSSLNSSADHILALEGTRLQRDLAVIMVKKYGDDPLVMQLISKHFYSEEVFDDSSSQPKLRWRYRNFYSDNTGYYQRTNDDSQNDSHKAAPSDSHNNFDSRKTDLKSKEIPVNSGTDLMGDPLDCVFGHTATTEEIYHSGTSSVPSKAQRRAHKRARHRHRLRQQEGSLGSLDA